MTQELTAGSAPDPLFRNLFSARKVLIFGEITMEKAHSVCAQLLALSSVSAEPIQLVVHSPGGHVESADSIFDMIRYVRAKVHILGSGWVASAGALIFVSVPIARRVCLPNTRFLLHQPLGGMGGPATDVEIEARQISLMRARLNGIFAEATGKSPTQIHADTDRNYWLSSSEAVAYGLVSRVVANENELADHLSSD